MSLITIIRLWPMRPMYINCRMAHGVVTLRPQYRWKNRHRTTYMPILPRLSSDECFRRQSHRSVTVVADNFTASGQTDYLYGKSDPLTVNKNSRAVTFTMCHALAKVSFRVLKSNNVEETVTLKKIELLSSTAGCKRVPVVS